MSCCTCAGSCNHVGNHSYCADHGGRLYGATPMQTTTTLIHPDLTPPATCATCEAKEDHISTLESEVEDLRKRLGDWEFFVRNRLYKRHADFVAEEVGPDDQPTT